GHVARPRLWRPAGAGRPGSQPQGQLQPALLRRRSQNAITNRTDEETLLLGRPTTSRPAAMTNAAKWIALAASVLLAAPSISQEAPSASSALPGGASSLQETYEDWSVVCGQQNGRKTCAMSQ